MRSKPVLNGKIYCSRWCGGNCTKAAFDRATKDSNALAKYLGKHWKPTVWENLGWHWAVFCGAIDVRPSLGQFRACLTASVMHDGVNGIPQFFSDSADARRAVADVISRFDKYIERVIQVRNKVKV